MRGDKKYLLVDMMTLLLEYSKAVGPTEETHCNVSEQLRLVLIRTGSSESMVQR